MLNTIQISNFCFKSMCLIKGQHMVGSARDVEIFLGMPVILTDFENLVSPNNKICSRNINFLSVRMKFCQSLNPSVWHFSTSQVCFLGVFGHLLSEIFSMSLSLIPPPLKKPKRQNTWQFHLFALIQCRQISPSNGVFGNGTTRPKNNSAQRQLDPLRTTRP